MFLLSFVIHALERTFEICFAAVVIVFEGVSLLTNQKLYPVLVKPRFELAIFLAFPVQTLRLRSFMETAECLDDFETCKWDFYSKYVKKMHIFDVPASDRSKLQCKFQTFWSSLTMSNFNLKWQLAILRRSSNHRIVCPSGHKIKPLSSIIVINCYFSYFYGKPWPVDISEEKKIWSTKKDSDQQKSPLCQSEWPPDHMDFC